MLTFLRKIRKSLIDSGSARKYLLYAIGEIALVVIGILIALQINQQRADAEARDTEQKLLIGFYNDLTKNLEDLEKDSSEYHDSLESYFGYAHRFAEFIPDRTNYEEAKSYGLDIISDRKLRSGIIKLYDSSFEQLKTSYRGQNAQYQSTVNLFNKYFSAGKNTTYRIPNDFNALKKNHEILNTISYLTVDRRDHSNYYKRLRQQIFELQQQVDSQFPKQN